MPRELFRGNHSPEELKGMLPRNHSDAHFGDDGKDHGRAAAVGVVLGAAVIGLIIGYVALMIIESGSFLTLYTIVVRMWYFLAFAIAFITGLLILRINNKHKEDFARLYRKIDRLEKKLDEMGVGKDERD